MFCINCGKQLEDGSKFCPNCGTKQEQPAEPEVAVEPEVPEEQTPAADACPKNDEAEPKVRTGKAVVNNSSDDDDFPFFTPPVTEKKKINGLFIGAGAAAAVVVIIAAVILFVSGVFSGPQAKLGKAVHKSIKAYEAVYNDLGGMDAAALISGEKYSQNVNFTIDRIDGDNTYEGFGARIGSSIDIPGQKTDIIITPFLDEADLATIRLGLSGTQLYGGSPELTDGLFYGIDTSTLGQDIASFSGNRYMEDLSFNVYDVIKSVKELQDNEAVTDAVKAANKELLDSLEITKLGKETVKVNGGSLKSVKYHVVLTIDAIEGYLDAIEDTTADVSDMADGMEDILESIGLNDEIQRELMSGYDSVDTGYVFDTIHDALDEMDDFEADFYVSGGYLVAAEYEGEYEDTKFSLEAHLGGGDNYVDDISVTFEVKGAGEVSLTSTGNHAGKGGIFTDKTVLTLKESGSSKETLFSSESEYAKKDHSYSGELEIGEDVSISFKGTWKMDKSSFDMQLDKLKIKSYGEVVFEGAFGYGLGSYEKVDKVSDVIMVLTKTEDELTEIAKGIYDNFREIAEEQKLEEYGISLPEDPFGSDSGTSEPAAGPEADYWYGYDAGYYEGYWNGWYEDSYDTYLSYVYTGDAYTGYLDGYRVGYEDGWYGYDEYENYGAVYDESDFVPAPETGESAEGGEVLATSNEYWIGYMAGYDAGYEAGWDETESDTYPGYVYGYSGLSYIGYIDGYEVGYDDGWVGDEHSTNYGMVYNENSPGYDGGRASDDLDDMDYWVGYDDGYNEGYNEEIGKAYQPGSEWADPICQEGYEAGYNDGYEDGQHSLGHGTNYGRTH